MTTINKLKEFSTLILHLGEPILDDRLLKFEQKINFKLPNDFKEFLTQHNGFSLTSTEVNGIGNEFRDSSLDKLYDFEHFEVGNPMPKEFVPFSADGFGNHYCLDLSRINIDNCAIVFWQHDFEYETLDEVETCYNSFIEWVEEVMILWTLEEYKYDGSEK